MTTLPSRRSATHRECIPPSPGKDRSAPRWSGCAHEAAPGRVEFLGALPREQLLERVRAARAVVLPSLWVRERADDRRSKALASGVPVVASAIGGLPEIVRDGETGLLFPAGSADELGARLRLLAADAALARALGEGGRRLVEREHRLSDQVSRMLQILAEVASFASR